MSSLSSPRVNRAMRVAAGWETRAARLAAALLLAAGGAALLYLTRGTTFWLDEWSWVIERRGWDDAAFLQPHNGHLSVLPVAVYKLLFELVGLERSLPYRLVLTALHLLLVALVLVYVTRRIGTLPGLVAAAVLLAFGPGAQNLVWTFQITWLGSLSAGVGAFLMLDRRDRAGDVAAAVLLGVSLACSGLGIPIVVGLVIEVVLARRRWWVVGAPLALYALWWLAYQDYESFRSVTAAPRFAADAAAATLSSLAGLAGPMLESTGEAYGWGRPLAVLAAVALVWRLASMAVVPARTWALLAIPVVFWLAVGLERWNLSGADTSRYMTVGAVFVLMLVAELARGVRLSRQAAVAVVALVVLTLVSNAGVLRRAASEARAAGAETRAVLGAVELAGARGGEDTPIAGLPGHPFVQVQPADYLEATADYGSPAATPTEIAAAPESAREAADLQLLRMEGDLLDDRPATAADVAPTVDRSADGSVETAGRGCVVFRPDPITRVMAAPAVELTVPPEGLLLETDGGPAALTLRRFATGFGEDPHVRLVPGRAAAMPLGATGATPPWHVRIEPAGELRACDLRAAS